MAREISKYDDVIDSRDVIRRIEELEELIEEATQAAKDAYDEAYAAHEPDDDETDASVIEKAREYAKAMAAEAAAEHEPDDEDVAELAALKALAEEASASPDWPYGEQLIRDSYFKQYAEELADDIGAIDAKLEGRWPYTRIDWDAAAEDLKADYMPVDYSDVRYWIRY